MALSTFIIVLLVVGFVLWVINAYFPMDAKIKQILNIGVVLFVIVWLLQATGFIYSMDTVHVGR